MRRAAFLTTPPKISGEIRRFCDTISPLAPLMIKAVPFPGCDGDDAFAILPGHVQRFGGQGISGWRIVGWPRVFLHAEPHMIWLSPKDEMIDVTATADRAGQSLFLPAPADKDAPLTPHRQALVRDADLAAWLDLAAQGREAEDQAMDHFLRVVRRFAKPGDPCWCGSGRQLRKCHPFSG